MRKKSQEPDRHHLARPFRYQRDVLRDVLIHFIHSASTTGIPPQQQLHHQRNLNMQWGIVQEQQQQRLSNHHQKSPQQPLTSCYMPSSKFMSPPPSHMNYLPQQQQNPKKKTPPQPPPRTFHSISNQTGNYVQEENVGINYVYSNSGKTFQYGIVPTTTTGVNSNQSQQYTSNINVQIKNR